MNADCTRGVRADSLRGERSRSAWIQLAAIACFTALAAPFFLGRVYVADDLGEFHLPVRNFYAEQLERGEAFDWMPSSGTAALSRCRGATGAYHPLHWLLYRCLPLGAAFDVELLVSYPLLFVGTICFSAGRVAPRRRVVRGARVHIRRVQPVALRTPECDRHFRPPAVAAVGDRCDAAGTDAKVPGPAWPMRVSPAIALLPGYPQFVWFSLLAETAFVFYGGAQRASDCAASPQSDWP